MRILKRVILCFAILTHAAIALAGVPERIISMSPAATEILFSLSLGDRLIGITQFCDYPPEVDKIPRVASMLDIGLETLLNLEPDLVVLVDLNASLKETIERLGIATFTLQQETLEELCGSIEELGNICGVPKKGQEAANSMRAVLRAAGEKTGGLDRPEVVVAIDRDLADPKIRSLYIAGKDSFYDDLIWLAGGRNAFETTGVTYPKLSAESLISLDPDVIIDIVGDHGFREGTTPQDLYRQWEGIPELTALKEKRIYLLTGDYALRPGPRLVQALADFLEFIHPELGRP